MIPTEGSHSSLEPSIKQQRQKYRLPIELNQGIPECRICLSNSEEMSSPLFKPCICSGSVSFVHQHCMKKWIEVTLSKKTVKERTLSIERGIPCEVCKSIIKFEVITSKACSAGPQIRNAISNKPALFTIFLILILLNLVGECFSLYYMIFYNSTSTSSEDEGFNLMISILCVCGAFFSLLFLAMAIFMIILEFFIHFTIEVGIVRSFSFAGQSVHRSQKSKINPAQDEDQNQTLQMISLAE